MLLDRSFKERDRLDMVVELKVQYCRANHSVSLDANETFLLCAIFKDVCNISPEEETLFYNSLITWTNHLKGVFAKNERGYRLNAIKKSAFDR